MAFVNFSTREITAKIVYYGPGLCGKTTSLQYIYDSVIPENKGQMVSLATDVDRTIYFDFLPLILGKIQNFTVRIQLYTVPGQVRYNSTRKLVLNGTDGVVFVADSQKELMDENIKSFKNLIENLKSHGISLAHLPHILQYNKRDLPNLSSVLELNAKLNKFNMPFFETCATSGFGILEGLKAVSKLVMEDLNEKGVISKEKFLRVVTKGSPTDTDSHLFPDGFIPVGKRAEPAVKKQEASAEFLSSAGTGGGELKPGAIVEETVDLGVQEKNGMKTENRTPAGRVPARDGSKRIGEEKIENTHAYAAEALSYPPNPLQTFSYSGTFSDPILGEAIFAMEKDICQGNFREAVVKARNILLDILSDEETFPDLQGEGNKALALGIPWKKYQSFVSIVKMSSPSYENAMFAHHFVMDAYFSKMFF